MAPARVHRLKWSCRRGLKELDVLLERFLAAARPGLERGDWPEFESLLDCEDDTLWAWLQSPDRAPGGEFRPLLRAIRDGFPAPASASRHGSPPLS